MTNRLDPQTQIAGLEHLTLGDFWSWAYSDVLNNRNRSIFAEFVVASALGLLITPRVEWDAVGHGKLRSMIDAVLEAAGASVP